jgi:hypothetical protein
MRLAIRPEFRCRRALVLNVSSGGLGFLLDTPLEKGTVLAMELGAAEEETKGLVARVVHSRPHPIPVEAPWLPRPSRLARLVRWVLRRPKPVPEGTAWVVGCQFNRLLTEPELQSLLHQVGARR